MKNIILKSSGILLFLFGLLNLFFSFSIIFDLFKLRKSESNYIFFIEIADLICGIIYLCSGYGLFKEKIWTTKFLFIAAFILIFTFIILMIYIVIGGNYEEKTFIAIPIRTFITLVFTLISWNYITKKNQFPGYKI
ncbi:MAG TPA: hypothetical protein VFI29_18335 [Hanamia sp.]|nr:hypothetical protein [Hanamia sp.]